MSAFLGPIHHWLFNKIRLFGDLEKNIIEAATAAGHEDINNYAALVREKFGYPLPDQPLQELIDESNIHGWLHTKIGECELRHAGIITYMIREYNDGLDIVKGVYAAQAEKCAMNIDTASLDTPEKIYKLINDYVLDGMPCDNVKCVTINEPDLLQWEVSNCLHKKYWDKVDGDINVFYDLREIWLSTFVDTLNSGYEFQFSKEDLEGRTNLISKIIRK